MLTTHAPDEAALKYVEQALNLAEPLDLGDVLVEPRAITLRTDILAPSLEGFLAFRYHVTKSGRLKAISKAIWREPSPGELLAWAREQPLPRLRTLLIEQGIQGKGNIQFAFYQFLLLRYEQAYQTRHGSELNARQRYLQAAREAALRVAIQKKGGDDSTAASRIAKFIIDFTERSDKEQHMATKGGKEPTPAEIRRRLEGEAEQADQAAGEKPPADEATASEEATEEAKEPTAEKKPSRTGKPKDETSAVKAAAKAKRAKVATQPVSAEKKKEAAKAAVEPGKPEHEEEEEMKGKGNKRAAAKKAKVAAHRGTGHKQSDFKPEMKVKYVAGRNQKQIGKQATILSVYGTGFRIKYSDGSTGTAAPASLEPIKK